MTRTRLQRCLCRAFRRELQPAAAVLRAGARCWAHLTRAGNGSQAAVAWGHLLHYAGVAGGVLASWRDLCVFSDQRPDARLLAAALAWRDAAAAEPDTMTEERAEAVLDALRRAALDLGTETKGR